MWRAWEVPVADPIANSTPPPSPTNDDILYPDWQPECRAVMIEIDPTLVTEKLAVAEAAIAKRTAQLKALHTPEDDAEVIALKEEGAAMRAAVADVLAHPDLKKQSDTHGKIHI